MTEAFIDCRLGTFEDVVIQVVVLLEDRLHEVKGSFIQWLKEASLYIG